MLIHLLMRTCHTCPFRTGPVCLKDGKRIVEHVKAHDCPAGNYPDAGLGDTLRRLIERFGVERVWKRLVGPNCGCEKRRKWLNRLMAYRR